jgi:hypothetical protein
MKNAKQAMKNEKWKRQPKAFCAFTHFAFFIACFAFLVLPPSTFS